MSHSFLTAIYGMLSDEFMSRNELTAVGLQQNSEIKLKSDRHKIQK